jgi:hypothetical protein
MKRYLLHLKLPNRQAAGLVYPALYHEYLHCHLDECHALHDSFIILLSKQIHLYPLAERKFQIQWLIQMLSADLKPTPGSDANPVAGMDSMKGLTWFLASSKFSEIYVHSAQAEDPDIGPLWRAMTPGDTNSPHFVDALEAFDPLMCHDCAPDDHLTMVNPARRDLALQPVPNFEEYLASTRLRSLDQIKDPFLQALANYAGGVTSQCTYS